MTIRRLRWWLSSGPTSAAARPGARRPSPRLCRGERKREREKEEKHTAFRKKSVYMREIERESKIRERKTC